MNTKHAWKYQGLRIRSTWSRCISVVSRGPRSSKQGWEFSCGFLNDIDIYSFENDFINSNILYHTDSEPPCSLLKFNYINEIKNAKQQLNQYVTKLLSNVNKFSTKDYSSYRSVGILFQIQIVTKTKIIFPSFFLFPLFTTLIFKLYNTYTLSEFIT